MTRSKSSDQQSFKHPVQKKPLESVRTNFDSARALMNMHQRQNTARYMSNNLFKKVDQQPKAIAKASAERTLEQNIDKFNKVLHSLKASPQKYSINTQKVIAR